MGFKKMMKKEFKSGKKHLKSVVVPKVKQHLSNVGQAAKAKAGRVAMAAGKHAYGVAKKKIQKEGKKMASKALHYAHEKGGKAYTDILKA